MRASGTSGGLPGLAGLAIVLAAAGAAAQGDADAPSPDAAAPAAIAQEPTPVPEPPGFWTGPFLSPVPATIAGGAVVDTGALRALAERGDALLVDVAPAPHRPGGQRAGQLWLPLAHADIPGSVWLPDLGLGALSEAEEAWFRERLAGLTGGDPRRTLVTYCHPSCWASWNAAKRLIAYGYLDVRWYPGGVEAWQAAGLPTARAEPDRRPD